MKNNSPEDIPSIADSMIQYGQKSKAEKFLKEFVSDTPPDWKPVTESQDFVKIAFWDMTEFISYVAHRETSEIKKKVLWVTPSYSKAFYLLAFMTVEREDWSNAIKYIDRGIVLESDHPVLLCEKALRLSCMNRNEEAYHLYIKAVDIRPWALSRYRAMALRGVAVILIDLERLDEAEKMLKKSLEIEPESEVAKNELSYIEDLRSGGKLRRLKLRRNY